MDDLLKQLIAAITLQSQAINNLAESNMALVDSQMTEQGEDSEPVFDMAGRRI